MSQTVDFATFCHAGDSHRLHAPGQLRRQVESNNYTFSEIIIIYQNCNHRYVELSGYQITSYQIADIDFVLRQGGIDLTKPQYASQTDKAHTWKVHTVNHLAAISQTTADYIVFADNDCWMVRQPEGKSWIDEGIKILNSDRDIFIVSPNDGEPERKTWRMSQQMFMARVDDFRQADFNQPGWDGNVNIPGGPMPEYWAMLEGRMELHCRAVGKLRYVLGSEYRYYHHNKLTEDDLFETDVNKY